MSAHHQRGQSLPVAAIGVIALIAFGFFALDYANTIRWQIRAQSAADSAAQAIMSIQTQQFNEMTAALYAAAVEEYRLRRNLNAMAMAANQKGGCGSASECANVYLALQPNFMRSVTRYGADVAILHRITASLSLAHVKSDSRALINDMIGRCAAGTPFADCAFSYTIVPNGIVPRSPTYAVFTDAFAIRKPEFGSVNTLSGVNDQLLAPVQVEVATCATVAPVLPGFFGYTPASKHVIGRAAATAVMTEQDWLLPGSDSNPWTGLPFQPDEVYRSPIVTDPANDNYDWYDLSFGGNGYKAYAGVNGGFKQPALSNDEFSVFVGWWNSVPIHTFTGTQDAASLGCGPA